MENSFKIVLVGPSGVGKTSLMNRFVEDEFYLTHNVTIGADYSKTRIKIEDSSISINIWDLGGLDRFNVVRNGHYVDAHGALLIFDLSKIQTFQDIDQWLEDFRQSAGNDRPFVLIGNKYDLVGDTEEENIREEAKKFAEKEGTIYIETSAKTDEKVVESFIELTRRVVHNI